MCIVGGAWLVFSLCLLSLGAWPVIGFGGLDVLGIYLAFRVSYSHARLYENVRLTADELEVERVWPSGRRQIWSFEPYWARAELTTFGPDGALSRLRIRSRDRQVILGAFLSPQERAAFAATLQTALADAAFGRRSD